MKVPSKQSVSVGVDMDAEEMEEEAQQVQVSDLMEDVALQTVESGHDNNSNGKIVTTEGGNIYSITGHLQSTSLVDGNISSGTIT